MSLETVFGVLLDRLKPDTEACANAGEIVEKMISAFPDMGSRVRGTPREAELLRALLNLTVGDDYLISELMRHGAFADGTTWRKVALDRSTNNAALWYFLERHPEVAQYVAEEEVMAYLIRKAVHEGNVVALDTAKDLGLLTPADIRDISAILSHRPCIYWLWKWFYLAFGKPPEYTRTPDFRNFAQTIDILKSVPLEKSDHEAIINLMDVLACRTVFAAVPGCTKSERYATVTSWDGTTNSASLGYDLAQLVVDQKKYPTLYAYQRALKPAIAAALPQATIRPDAGVPHELDEALLERIEAALKTYGWALANYETKYGREESGLLLRRLCRSSEDAGIDCANWRLDLNTITAGSPNVFANQCLVPSAVLGAYRAVTAKPRP